MSPSTRRALTIDDPVAGVEACHVAHPPPNPSIGRLREVALDEIHPNALQPRKRFDEASLNALADSIRERGVLQPIIVQPHTGGGYQLIAGERRWRASKIAARPTIPALVDDAVDGAVSLELALIENVAREDLTVMEEARTIASLLDDLRVTTAVLARRLGRSRSDLAHTVRSQLRRATAAARVRDVTGGDQPALQPTCRCQRRQRRRAALPRHVRHHPLGRYRHAAALLPRLGAVPGHLSSQLRAPPSRRLPPARQRAKRPPPARNHPRARRGHRGSLRHQRVRHASGKRDDRASSPSADRTPHHQPASAAAGQPREPDRHLNARQRELYAAMSPGVGVPVAAYRAGGLSDQLPAGLRARMITEAARW